jgi:hypothetical protein
MVALAMVSNGLLQVDDFHVQAFHNELDISMDTVKMLKEIVKLSLAWGQISVIRISVSMCQLMACCSKDSM